MSVRPWPTRESEHRVCARLRLTLAVAFNFDRTGPLLDGTIRPDGIDFVSVRLNPSEIFRRMAQDAEFDVAEMSMSTYISLIAHGDRRFIGIPVFPSRMFRHGFIIINTLSGIGQPSDLAGRRVGMTEYQMTAALWMRAILRDEYGVSLESIEWVEGGLNQCEPPRFLVPLPETVHLRRIPYTDTLSDMLERGSLDAVIDAQLPNCFRPDVPHIRRLFPDYHEVEADYFQRTRFFPIMHTVVMRRSIYEENPWCPLSIFQAFQQANDIGRQRLFNTSTLACALPWLTSELETIRTLFNGNAFPYGVAANRPILEYMVQQSYEQGLSRRLVDLSELFPTDFGELPRYGAQQ